MMQDNSIHLKGWLSRLRHCRVRMATLALALCALQASGTDAQDDAQEARVKAAYLYNFIKFVEWPGSKSPATSHRAEICTAGDISFENALDSLKKSLNGKLELVVSVNVAPDQLAGCNVLFIARNASLGLLGAAREQHVLTVSEQTDFIEKGGIIEMKTVEKTIGLFSSNKINLRINLPVAEQTSLRIDAQLLEIAAEVIK